METILIKGLQLIVALALLIILHEFGHTIAAKIFKVRVEKFCLFFDWKYTIFSTYSNWWRKLTAKSLPRKRKMENMNMKAQNTASAGFLSVDTLRLPEWWMSRLSRKTTAQRDS